MMDTLTPSWSQCLLFDRVLLEGTMEQLQRDPPLIIINIYDYDTMVNLTPKVGGLYFLTGSAGSLWFCWDLQ